MVNIRVSMGTARNASWDEDDVAGLASFNIWTQLRYPERPRAERGNQAACSCFSAVAGLN